MCEKVPIRRNPNHRPPGTPEGGPCPPVQQERIPAVPPPGTEGGGGHRPPRSERHREDDDPLDPQRGTVPEPRPLSPDAGHPGVLGRGPREVQGDRAPRLPRTPRREEGADGPEAAVRGQAPEGREGHRAGPPEEGRRPGSARRPRLPAVSRGRPPPGHRPPQRRGAPADRDCRDDAEGRGRVLLRRALLVPGHLPAARGREGDPDPVEGEAGRRRGARPRRPRLPRGHRVPDVRVGGRVRRRRAAPPRADRDQHVPRRVPEGGEHPLPGSRGHLRGPPPAEGLEGGGPRAVRGLEKSFDDFSLTVEGGSLRKGEVVGVVGPNATGKTTFVKMLAGEETPTAGSIEGKWAVSYKPQYIEPTVDGTVRELFASQVGNRAEGGWFLTLVEVTFRRDADTNRPRINKLDSRLDREQKTAGEYYYALA